jgi:hypothetical protein
MIEIDHVHLEAETFEYLAAENTTLRGITKILYADMRARYLHPRLDQGEDAIFSGCNQQRCLKKSDTMKRCTRGFDRTRFITSQYMARATGSAISAGMR